MAENYSPLPDEWLEEMEELADAEYGRLIRWYQGMKIHGTAEKLCGNERFYTKRCLNTLARFQEAERKRSDDAKVAAEKRWNGMRQDATACEGMRGHATACEGMRPNATECDPMPEHATNTNTNTSTSTSTSTSKKDVERDINAHAREAADDAFETFADGDAELLNTLRDFEKMRKKIKKPLSDRAKSILVNKLAGFQREQWIAILEQSILNSWQGIYPLREEGGAHGTGENAASRGNTKPSESKWGHFEDAIERKLREMDAEG